MAIRLPRPCIHMSLKISENFASALQGDYPVMLADAHTSAASISIINRRFILFPIFTTPHV
jgi:hypothetical protein